MLSTEILGASLAQKLQLLFDYSKGKPCEKTKLNNINLTYHGDKGVVASTCSNVKGITTTKNWAYSGVHEMPLEVLKMPI